MGTGKNLSECYETVIVSLARHVEELMAMKQHWEERAMEYSRKFEALQKEHNAFKAEFGRVMNLDKITAGVIAANNIAGHAVKAEMLTPDVDFFPGFAIPEEVNAPDA